ncbi:DUF3971 domain-containing protein [Halomonas sp. 1513]|nr:AsmA-like C-terminal region-containing protein [Halomonas sp. 1513]APX93670.1 DUF3971 domain-containing protein [Halomonas sp. 1513]
MSPLRVTLRWALTLAAICLTLLAILVVALRLALGQVDMLRDNLETLLSARFNAEVSVAELSAGVDRLDPRAELSHLRIASRDGRDLPLLEVEHARLRLDSGASLRDWVPVIEDARIRQVTVHLYQTPERTWHWPEPAELPPEFQPDTRFDLERLDFWVGALLRQRVEAEQVRLVLHGLDRQVVLEAPSLLMTGDRRRTHVEGWLYVEGQPETALEAALEVQPGPRGLADFSAALQARMDIASLVELAEVLSRNDPVRLDEAHGQAELWGRWQQGALQDARLDLDVPQLVVSNATSTLALADIRARGQWLREGPDGWQAWLSREPLADDDATHGPAIPEHWHLVGEGRDWWLNTSGFELDALAAWRNRVPLPEGLVRVLDSLDPQGRISGFGVGRRNGSWQALGAFHQVAVSPWQNAPGGGPIDAWVEAEDLHGKVTFVGDLNTTLNFSRLFGEPMQLDAARGVVQWDYRGERVHVDGQDLEALWRGAQVQGGFDLALGGDAPGELGLDLTFRDIDAVETPLRDWLPVGVFGEALNDWLELGAAGRVTAGTLSLRQPLREGIEPDDIELELALELVDGFLPFAEGWPALEDVSGRLAMDDMRLEAWVDHAESLGVVANDGRVSLADGTLTVLGELAGSSEAVLAYLAALPFFDLDSSDFSGSGALAGDLALELPLGDLEALSLDIDAQVDVPTLVYVPLDITMQNVNGSLAYRHRDDQGGVDGVLGARVFGGPLRADFDTREQGVDFSGRALASGLLDWTGLDAAAPILDGVFPYSARLDLAPGAARFRFDSDLSGLAIRLPAPFGKPAASRAPLFVDADLESGVIEGELAERLRLRWREWGRGAQGQAWLEQWPTTPAWPDGSGWEVDWRTSRIDTQAWAEALGGLGVDGLALGDGTPDQLRALRLATPCLEVQQRCLGSLYVSAYPWSGDDWRLDVDGSLLEGRVDYRPAGGGELDVALVRLNLDALMPEQADAEGLLDEIAVAPTPAVFPDWIGELPDGRLRVARLLHEGKSFGPLTARWRASPGSLQVAPLGLTLGRVSARGEIDWEASGGASLTRSRLSLDGGDLGSALERLDQPMAISNASTRVRSQLAWPGAPWQFGLDRSRGSLDIDLRDGRFRYLESPSARLVGLLNFDNLLRRLRLDFTDVTGQGTAFDSVIGSATLYGGILETRGPVVVEAPATRFTLDGQVDLARRELDQRLGVTVPVSQNLPLAAVAAGAPIVGGALFIAHRLFGGAIDRATQIHYRVRGPWTSPQISLEGGE